MESRVLDFPSYSPKRKAVEFAVLAPQAIKKKTTFILDVWAYLPSQYSDVIARACETERKLPVGRKSGVLVPEGELLTIAIRIDKLNVKEPIDTIFWSGVPTNASFIVEVPPDVRTDSFTGLATIGCQGITIAKVAFLVPLTDHENKDYIDYSSRSLYPKTAFASYASDNREEVLARIQGMKKIAPDLDIFIDVFSLRSGENWKEKLDQQVPVKDTFYLFWSQSASKSKWVDREWRLALERRGLEYIDPVPLDEPDNVPPPQELNALHFADAYMAYINYQRIKKRKTADLY